MVVGKFGGSEGEPTLRWMRQDLGMTVSQIADEYHCSKTTIQYWLDKYDISPPEKETPWRDEENLRRLYVEQRMSQKKVADRLGCSPPTIRKWLEEHNIPVREPDWRTDTSRHRQDLWADVRERVLERDNHECQRCGSEEDLVVHHVTMVSEGGDEYDPENLETVCEECHYEEHWG